MPVVLGHAGEQLIERWIGIQDRHQQKPAAGDVYLNRCVLLQSRLLGKRLWDTHRQAVAPAMNPGSHGPPLRVLCRVSRIYEEDTCGLQHRNLYLR